MANFSPYTDQPVENWRSITEALVAEHPLSPDEVLEVALVAWGGVWSTEIGKGATRISLRDVNPPATVVGYFFERLFAKELATRHPKEWRGELSGDEKDLHCLVDSKYSTEIKSSGQLGLKIFGNRSYGQVVENEALAKKDKSGYYITVNFFGERLTLIRFGWIDGADWKPQKSPTGQMAGLEEETYRHKLIAIRGSYALEAPIALLDGVGAKTAAACAEAGIYSIRDALSARLGSEKSIARVQAAAAAYAAKYGPAQAGD